MFAQSYRQITKAVQRTTYSGSTATSSCIVTLHRLSTQTCQAVRSWVSVKQSLSGALFATHISIFATASPQPDTLTGTELALKEMLMVRQTKLQSKLYASEGLSCITALQNEVVHNYCFTEI